MGCRTIIIESDPSLRHLLTLIAQRRGHEVMAFADPGGCTLFAGPGETCTQKNPCCDILIIDYELPFLNGMEVVERQLRGGCWAKVENKACIDIGDEKITARAKTLGCAVFAKPFSVQAIDAWLAACEMRVAAA